MSNKIIVLWAHPRSASTAFERIMHERGDLRVLHEPFNHLYYFHEGRAEAVACGDPREGPKSYEEVKSHIIDASEDKPVFFKDMCYHCHDHIINDDEFLKRLTNIFLIRDPIKSIPSHFNINPNAVLDEMGYEKEFNIFHKVASLTGTFPMVIDTRDLIANPHGIVKRYCDLVGLPFMESALNWEAGYKPEWDVWKGWHKSVSSSSGIQEIKSTYNEDVLNNATQKQYYDYHLPFYNQLLSHANPERS
uniref:Sulfotransferase family protein n=1 Tax=Candidatus Kentrum sp. FM TaxID=2126340 RepID=A0A450T433_9GAMM|nr:MAG: hypothetical protein BECKFM1743A_GA0114220_102783 [Candidatus Kentron sp. FM]VFJ61561.1 MAG: hypothetical protein BECKFM1743C_GA0114222_102953 [Candidatus Kentron sp. FM]VFK13662.1 MAG: hypothetical protein BECKFM1743B_GA0114221_102903 [Candidatus Kentron sp. FM]